MGIKVLSRSVHQTFSVLGVLSFQSLQSSTYRNPRTVQYFFNVISHASKFTKYSALKVFTLHSTSFSSSFESLVSKTTTFSPRRPQFSNFSVFDELRPQSSKTRRIRVFSLPMLMSTLIFRVLSSEAATSSCSLRSYKNPQNSPFLVSSIIKVICHHYSQSSKISFSKVVVLNSMLNYYKYLDP